jgi:hypothetical protein
VITLPANTFKEPQGLLEVEENTNTYVSKSNGKGYKNAEMLSI